MAATDYKQRGSGHAVIYAELAAYVGRLAPTIEITTPQSNDEDPVVVGMAAMVGDEVCRVTSVTDLTIGVDRGCADTIPEVHEEGTPVWFFTNELGSDRLTYTPGETVGVKLLSYTSSGEVPTDYAPPHAVTFNWRHARPYPPANVKCKGEAWFERRFDMGEIDVELPLTWAHRDRVLQVDQLIGHTASSIGPESGVTYTALIHNDSGVLLRTVEGVTLSPWSYTRTMAAADFGSSAGTVHGTITLKAVRGTLDSLASYVIDFSTTLNADGPIGINRAIPFTHSAMGSVAVITTSDSSLVIESVDGGFAFTQTGLGQRLTSWPQYRAVRADGRYVSIFGESVERVSVSEFPVVIGDFGTIGTATAQTFDRTNTPIALSHDGGKFVLLTTPNLIWHSTDGDVWASAGSVSGFPALFSDSFITDIYGSRFASNWLGAYLRKVGSRWFLTIAAGTFYTDNPDATGVWTQCAVTGGWMLNGYTTPSFGGRLYSYATKTDGGVAKSAILASADGGLNWSSVYEWLPSTAAYRNLNIIGGKLVMVGDIGLAKSLVSTDGDNWNQVANNLAYCNGVVYGVMFGSRLALRGRVVGSTAEAIVLTEDGITFTPASLDVVTATGLGNNLGNSLGG